MQGVYYSDLVRVFHYNLKFRGNIGYTKVKGVEIILDDNIWTNVAQIPPSADRTSILSTHIDGFNRILTYQSLLRQPDLHISKKLLAGPLTIKARLLYCLIVWILCPRGTNHAQCSEADLLIIYCLMKHIMIDWSMLFMETMLKARKLTQYHLPYSLLISCICEYKQVPTERELCQSTSPSNEISDSSLRQMKIVQFGGGYVHKDDVPNYEDDEGTPSPDPVPPQTNVRSSSNATTGSSISLEDHILGLNQRLEDFFLLSTSRHEEVLSIQGEYAPSPPLGIGKKKQNSHNIGNGIIAV